MESIALIVGISTGFVSLGTAVIGVGAFLRASARKEYASEREIGHLKRNQEQLTQNVHELWRQNDDRFDSLDKQMSRIEVFLLGRIPTEHRSAHEIGKGGNPN